ncbi:MAG: sterol desaturase family protein [Sulfurospirillaceae bacterium]|nr:sterol desaturase family protein [Sulfurospirillaceae bacterium]
MKDFILKITAAKWNYYFSLVTDGMTGLVFLILSFHFSEDLWSSIALFVVGVVCFTFIEYAVHAWLFHKNHFLKVFIEGHAHHHQNPFSYDAMPFFVSALMGLLAVELLSHVMPHRDAFAFIGGLAMGYFNYGLTHHIMHRKEFSSPYYKYLQKFHFVHHKKPKMNHGITTDIFDRIFGTYYQWSEEDLKGMEKLKRIKK